MAAVTHANVTQHSFALKKHNAVVYLYEGAKHHPTSIWSGYWVYFESFLRIEYSIRVGNVSLIENTVYVQTA